MSKGEKLIELLAEGERIHALQVQIFVTNNAPMLDLKALPEDDRKRWLELHAENIRLSKQMVEVLCNNTK